MLTTLVTDANVDGVELPLQLTVSGVLVSGVLVGVVRWFELYAAHVDEHWQGEGPCSMAVRLREALVSHRVTFQTRPETPPAHMHLLEASVWAGDDQAMVGFWRGRIAAVDGWSVGRPS